IELSTKKVMEYWIRVIPLRLLRSGQRTSLYIDIRDTAEEMDNDRPAPTDMDTNEVQWLSVKQAIVRILDILAGENGCLCARWKSLRILLNAPFVVFKMHPGGIHELSSLTHPMPSLALLHLKLRSAHSFSPPPLFPDLPSINSITLENSFMHNYPDMSHARAVSMRGGYCVEDGVRYGLIKAQYVQHLHFLYDGYVFCHPREYPVLRTLSLEGPCMTRNLEQVSMPQLETITLFFHRIFLIREIAGLSAISHIRVLHLMGHDVTLFIRSEGIEAVSKTLRACRKLQTLYVNDLILSLLLEDWSTWGHLLQEASHVRVILRTHWGRDRPLVVENADTVKDLQRVARFYRVRLPDALYNTDADTFTSQGPDGMTHLQGESNQLSGSNGGRESQIQLR
ncbi:hypothetical protein FRC16_007410, partial [Serendipita sp. 398]